MSTELVASLSIITAAVVLLAITGFTLSQKRLYSKR